MSFGRLERPADPQPMNEINMTPLIDVMLVLLVIFIVTAPLMTSSLQLNLPKSNAAKPGDAPKFVSVAIDASGRLYLDSKLVDAPQLSQRFHELAQRNPETEVQLRADQAVPYGKVAEFIGLIQKAGLSRIGFVAEVQTGR